MFAPGFAAIRGAVTLPMRSSVRDLGPGESGEDLATGIILPPAMKIDRPAFKSSAPDQESPRRRCICPGMFPLRGLRIEGAESEALDDRSLIRSLEEFQGNAAIQDPASRERARALAPGSIGQRKAAHGVPLAFEKIKLLCLRDRGFENYIAHTDLRVGLPRNRAQSLVMHTRKT